MDGPDEEDHGSDTPDERNQSTSEGESNQSNGDTADDRPYDTDTGCPPGEQSGPEERLSRHAPPPGEQVSRQTPPPGEQLSRQTPPPGGRVTGEEPPPGERVLVEVPPLDRRVPDERGLPPVEGPRHPTDGPADPVKRAFAGETDLYDVATWEVRTPLDSFAVSVTETLRSARSALLVSVAFVLFLAQIVVAGSLVLEEPLLALLTLASVMPALAVAGYIWYRDPTRREPFVLLAVTFVLSMLFASFAAIVNSTFVPAFEALGVLGLTVFFFLVVGPIEEFVKWLAIRVYAYKSDAFRTVIDGVVYGAVAGVGFAAIENLIYIVLVYLETAPAGATVQTEYATSVAGQRAFAGPGHVIFSAWAGFYLGLAKFNPGQRGPIVAKGLLIAAFIHALYNTMVTVLPLVIPLSVGGLLLAIVLYHGFWFGLLYRKVAAYQRLYQQLDPTE